MAKIGGLLKLDAICAKLKTSLETQPSQEDDQETKEENQLGTLCDSEEPNNNMQTVQLLKDNTIGRSSLPDDNEDEIPEDSSYEHIASNGVEKHDSVVGHGVEILTDSTESRKSRRKAKKPRNICHLQTEPSRDEVLYYEENHSEEMDFHSICEAAMEEEDDFVGENQSGNIHEGNEFHREHSISGANNDNDDDVMSNDERDLFRDQSLELDPGKKSSHNSPRPSEDSALDLSISRSTISPNTEPSILSSTRDSGIPEENGVLNLSMSPRKPARSSEPTKAPTEEVEMKDYAENTMNELLNMYGLGEDDDGPSHKTLPPFSGSRHSGEDRLMGRGYPGPGYFDDDEDEESEEDSLSMSSSSEFYAKMRDQTPGGTIDKDYGDHLSHGKLPDGAGYGPQNGGDITITPSGRLLLPDYYKYLKRYNSHEECKGNHCEDMGYKEHFHCLDCSFRVFVKKEEMIRHFKWHKKRDESLQHGFMRYSPMDDCTKRFVGSCSHYGKQTHYHCLQDSCSKVYISTSDVQMHANYHRKDSAILQEGFQRFRATEDCGTQSCSFYNQRTTHFHCRRTGCSFTFKNKADMEKHKAYHQKDEILAKDGFKKFMKYEHCNFLGCRYSKASNHIHCIRPGCNYVLHSTGQLFSHKRKHERRDFEFAYKRFKQEQPVSQMFSPESMTTSPRISLNKEFVDLEDLVKMGQPLNICPSEASSFTSEPSPGPRDMTSLSSTPGHSDPNTPLAGLNNPFIKTEPLDLNDNKPQASTLAKLATKLNGPTLGDSLTLPIPGQFQNMLLEPEVPVGMSQGLVVPSSPAGSSQAGQATSSSSRVPSPQTGVSPSGFIPKLSPPVNEKRERDESWKKYLTRYTANDPCHSRCQFLYKDHYHCNTANCGMLFRSKDGVREHAKYHEQQARITSLAFMTYEEGTSCSDSCDYSGGIEHYHCLWADCKQVITVNDQVFARMEHYKIHEYSRTSAGRRMPPSASIKAQETFKRKRGRPPKYPKNEIPSVPKISLEEEEISTQARHFGPEHPVASGFKKFSPSQPCPDDKCMFFMKEHYHCVRKRCHQATDRYDVLNLHAKDFHSYINILEGFEFFDRTVNCRRPHCHNNRANRHFHCVRPRCDYSFVRVSTMAQHDKKHKMAEMGLTPSPSIGIPRMAFMTTGTPPTLPTNGMPVMPAPRNQPVNIAPAPRGFVRATGTYFPVATTAGPMLSSGMVQVTPTPPVMVAVPSKGIPVSGPPTNASIMMLPQSGVPLSPSSAVVAPIVIAPISTSAGSPPHIISVPQSPISTQFINVPHSNPVPQLVNIAPKPTNTSAMTTTTSALPLTMLLQQKATNAMPQPSWISLLLKMHYSAQQNCGRPFCKLKKRDHYHCFDCNQAFSDPSRLKSHIVKHGFHFNQHNTLTHGRVIPMPGTINQPVIHPAPSAEERPHIEHNSAESLSENEDENSEIGGSLNLNPGAFSNLLGQNLDQGDSSEETTAMDLTVPVDKPLVAPPMVPNARIKPKMDDHIPKAKSKTVEQKNENNSENEGNSEERSESPEQNSDQSSDFLESLGLVSKSTMPSSPEEETIAKRRSGRKRVATKHMDFIDSDAAVTKIRRISSPRQSVSSPRQASQSISKTAPGKSPPSITTQSAVNSKNISSASKQLLDDCEIPDGYQKYKFNEDCNFDRCAYRQSQSHYHCVQKDCGYAFCDSSRFAQHNERHQRILNLMGEEFQQYRANIDCGRSDCEYTRRSNHFHCLKCPFICTDSNKVVAHRKHHAKTDTSGLP